jgi:replicative superfamily II helicase
MLRALFIGIDRHADDEIRELVGASRDATALWALVADTIVDVAATRLVNAEAGVDAVRGGLAIALADATPDDTVILSFSGHGTRHHRLVCFDTDRARLDETTIGLDELADLFRGSAARAILCVVDCCFSGAAPGRVLDDSPIARDLGPGVEMLAGNGRVLLAACRPDELAYESPTERHGLLTHALLRTLQEGDAPAIDVTAATANVLERVRASAAQLGVTQTPVLWGHIEGGLTLPRLTPGTRFFAAFPEAVGVRVSEALADLSAFGIPDSVVAAWQAQFASGLNALQLAAVNDHRILDGASLLVVAPTSAGKTFIGEMAAVRAITEGRKAVFLLPYRALVNEKYDTFTALYGETFGLRVVRCTGDYTDDVGRFVRGKYDLAVLTYEMFLNLVVRNSSIRYQLGLVVLDEAQFITDPMRGITVELLLTYLLTARARGIAPQLIALSAVIGNVNAFDEWLGSGRLVSTTRPVPLVEGVLDRRGQFQHVDADGNECVTALLTPHEIAVRGEKPSAQDVIVPLVRKLLTGTNEKVIVFRNQRGPAEGCARYLARDLALAPAAVAIAALPERDLSTTSASLRVCLAGGTAFHNTNLSREEKQIVERAFRDPGSPPRLLAATTTVAAGINTPASTVIIAEQEFVGEDGRPFTVAEYKNMAGRAGRLGFNEQGKAIILANDPIERARLFSRYVRGQLEQLTSSFDPRELDTWVVRLLAQVARVPRVDVVQLLVHTFGGYLSNRRQPGWLADMEARLGDLLGQMVRLGLVEEEAGDVQLTLLGRACGESSLSFRSAMRLVELVRGLDVARVTPERLMALVQALPEADSGYTPVFKKGTKESANVTRTAARYGREVAELLRRYADDLYGYYSRCKRAALLWDWIAGVPVETLEADYTVTPFQGRVSYGDIRRFADATRFHLRAAHQITNVLFLAGGPTEDAIDELLKRLEIGLPREALPLLGLRLPLTRGEYLALFHAGLISPEAVSARTEVQLTPIVGAAVARRLAPPHAPLPDARLPA